MAVAMTVRCGGVFFYFLASAEVKSENEFKGYRVTKGDALDV
jgi:hypothetical protein